MQKACPGSLTDVRAEGLDVEVLGESAVGGADEGDGDLVATRSWPFWGRHG